MNNIPSGKTVIARGKILWCPTQGHLILGEPSVHTSFMPHVLAWVVYALGNSDSIIEYSNPNLGAKTMSDIRLGYVFQIIQSRPDIICNEQKLFDKNKCNRLNLFAIISLILIFTIAMNALFAWEMLQKVVRIYGTVLIFIKSSLTAKLPQLTFGMNSQIDSKRLIGEIFHMERL